MKVTQLVCAALLAPLIGAAVPLLLRLVHDPRPHHMVTVPLPPEPFRPAPRLERPDDPVDLYGNVVAPAVSQYRTTASGSLYELHAPHVEIPKLGVPVS